jgi:short-subunit dehydrogenase
MNEWALVTGASSGIGLELARLLAADRFNLILVARNESRLAEIAAELKARHGIQARTIAKDLAESNASRDLFQQVQSTPVSVLVNNAGVGWKDTFAKGKLECWENMMRVNMDAVVQLTHLFLPAMLSRRQGRILNVASTAAFQPGPTKAIYYASKAFVYSFSCALAAELDGTGVTVTALCPGVTRTAFHERARMKPSLKGLPTMEAADVARIGYRALLRGSPVIIPGAQNKITSTLAKLAPTRLVTRAVKRLNAD